MFITNPCTWRRTAVGACPHHAFGAAKTVPVCCQRSSTAPGVPVVWDYHVVALVQHKAGDGWVIYDLDTTLAFPCPAKEYLHQACPWSVSQLKPQYHWCDSPPHTAPTLCGPLLLGPFQWWR